MLFIMAISYQDDMKKLTTENSIETLSFDYFVDVAVINGLGKSNIPQYVFLDVPFSSLFICIISMAQCYSPPSPHFLTLHAQNPQAIDIQRSGGMVLIIWCQ